MNVFFAELNILAVSIIGVLLSVVVPEIMLNVTSRKVQ
jgi:type II secretory pathway pseudopilin PulG